MSDEWVVLYHVVGCGGPACKILQSACYPGALIKSANFRHLDGRPIVSRSIPRCDTCGRNMWIGRLSRVPPPEP